MRRSKTNLPHSMGGEPSFTDTLAKTNMLSRRYLTGAPRASLVVTQVEIYIFMIPNGFLNRMASDYSKHRRRLILPRLHTSDFSNTRRPHEIIALRP